MTVRFPHTAFPALHIRDLALAAALLVLIADHALPVIRAGAQQGVQSQARAGEAQTAFTYQGRLELDGLPANGLYQFEFKLWSAAVAGSVVASYGPVVDVPVTNGLFVSAVDFALPYTEGTPRWIEVLVRPNASADPFISLGRQPFRTAPHDHLYQDWIGSSANAGLSLRNLGAGDAFYAEAGDGNAIEATSSGAAATLNVANQGGGFAISASTASGDAAIQGVASQGIGVAGATFKTGLPGVSGVHGGANCSSVVDNGRVNLGPACLGLLGVADATTSGGIGVFGQGTAWGILGRSVNGTGVRGEGYSAAPAVEGANTAQGCSPGNFHFCSGVTGEGLARGVVGTTTGSCNSTASISSVCIGVVGQATGGSASIGVYGLGSYAGVYGDVSGGAAYAGYFNGNVRVTGQINPPPSDVRLKHDIAPATSGLDAILALKPSVYAWNDPAPWDEDGRAHNGFIAQEVREILPSAVYVRDDAGTLGLDYNEITAVLVKAVQEQNALIEELRSGRQSSTRTNAPGVAGAPSYATLAVTLGLTLLTLGLVLSERRKMKARLTQEA